VRKESFPSQVYIGELESGSKRVRPPQRLINDEAVEWATAWTADSKAVLFTSDRGGKWGVLKQAIAENTAQPLIQGRESANLVRLGPDGSWVLYSENSLARDGRSRHYRLMQLALTGGPPRLVYETTEAELQDYSCARAPASRCVAIELDHNETRLTVTALDPVKGKGELLRTVETAPGTGFAWALSPDASMLAMAKGKEPEIRIRLLSLTGSVDQEIAVKGWPSIASMDWAPDGEGLYCGSVTSQSGTLLYVDRRGFMQVVARSREIGGGAFIAGVPSPNGRYLAFPGAYSYSNAWLIEAF